VDGGGGEKAYRVEWRKQQRAEAGGAKKKTIQAGSKVRCYGVSLSLKE